VSEKYHKTDKMTQPAIGGNILSKLMYTQLPQAKAPFTDPISKQPTISNKYLFFIIRYPEIINLNVFQTVSLLSANERK
jgi:hypothetical protein